MKIDSIEEELQEILGIKPLRIDKEVRIQSDGRSYIIDVLMEDQTSIFYIEVKRKLTPEVVANFYIAKEIIMRLLEPDKKRIFLIASQNIDELSEKMATLLGIRVLKISLASPELNLQHHSEGMKVKITSKKAWKVVFSLLQYGPTSIYNIKKMSGVSYGEAHRVISYFRSRDLLKQNGNFVSVSDLRPILNAVFWERPMNSIMVDSYTLEYGSDENIPRIISNLLEKNGIDHAFTGLTAYERYFGGIRNESSYDLYVDNSNPIFNVLINEITSSGEKGAKLFIYKPDREVLSGSTKIGDVTLVSKEQLLLDLSGGDKISLQLASEMVSKLGKI